MQRPLLPALLAAVIAAGATGPLAAESVSAPAPAACPDREPPSPLRSARPGAGDELVPAGQDTVLLCRFAGLNGPGPRLGLLGAVRLTDGSTVNDLAAQMNQLPRGASGPVACPEDDGSEILAGFGYSAGPSDPVTVSLTGCTAATNGQISRVATSALLSRLKGLVGVPVLGAVSGVVRVCGGPRPGGCHVGAFTDCTAGRGCATTDAVRVVGLDGRTLVTVPLRRGRFHARLAPGRYRLKLLADGRRIHARVVQAATVTVVAGQTVAVTFGVSVP